MSAALRIRFKMQAHDGDRFAPDAFERSVGKTVPFNGRTGKLIGYTVSDDGSEVEFDCEVPRDLLPHDLAGRAPSPLPASLEPPE